MAGFADIRGGQFQVEITHLSTDARIYIAGHRGLVGSALWRHFAAGGFTELLGASSSEVDLRDRSATQRFMQDVRPDVVICAAARVGGIGANSSAPAEFISDNLRIQVNVLDSAVTQHVPRLLFLGSSCIYPRDATQPISESALHTGPLEPTNMAYAVAKLAGLAQVTAIRQQYGLPYIAAMPTNLYGPGDCYDPATAHVLPSLIRRFHDAKLHRAVAVRCWGTGRPLREFLYVDDLAHACHFLLDHYDDEEPINVGSGTELSIAELATTVADVVGYDGRIDWNQSRPDGTPRKRLDTRRLDTLGWRATTPLREGLIRTYGSFLDTYSTSSS